MYTKAISLLKETTWCCSLAWHSTETEPGQCQELKDGQCRSVLDGLFFDGLPFEGISYYKGFTGHENVLAMAGQFVMDF